MINSASVISALDKKIADLQSQIIREYPDIQADLENNALAQIAAISTDTLSVNTIQGRETVSDTVEKKLENTKRHRELIERFPIEEKLEILHKMTSLTDLAPGFPADDIALYLEQQVSDIFGFQVSGKYNGHQLPYLYGRIDAELNSKEIKTGINSSAIRSKKHRSTLISSNAKTIQEYTVGLPLHLLPGWNEIKKQMKSSFSQKKILVINPHDAIAIIAELITVAPILTTQFQFSGSPNLIRDGLFWSPKNQGRCITYFIDDPTDSVAFGAVRMLDTSTTL